MSLKDKAKKANSSKGITFMDGRELGQLPRGIIQTIKDFGFIKSKKSDHMAVIELAEYPEHFFFGGSIVSDKLNELEATLEPDDVKEMHEVGIPVIFTVHKSKTSGNEYVNCEFYPTEGDQPF